jgi:hypothetical protein
MYVLLVKGSVKTLTRQRIHKAIELLCAPFPMRALSYEGKYTVNMYFAELPAYRCFRHMFEDVLL